jgi:hypothetical protein
MSRCRQRHPRFPGGFAMKTRDRDRLTWMKSPCLGETWRWFSPDRWDELWLLIESRGRYFLAVNLETSETQELRPMPDNHHNWQLIK